MSKVLTDQIEKRTGGTAIDLPASGKWSATTQLDATGTASATTYLRGDNAWSTIETGTSWQSVQTTGFTAVAGKGYPCNTTSAAFTATLPASASVGDTIEFIDYAGTFDTNALLLDPQSLNLKGATADLELNQERQGIRIVYADATQGWVAATGVNESAPAIKIPPAYVAATGPDSAVGVIDGDYKYHTFTASKTGSAGFVVSNAGNATGSNTLEYLVIAGGGGGGAGRAAGNYYGAGGGGAGGYRTATGLACPAVGNVDVTVGAGGTGGVASNTSDARGVTGSDSVFVSITSDGGGGGGGGNAAAGYYDGKDGGSGGGGGGGNITPGGSATAGQGYDGGLGNNYAGGGAGGAGAIGAQGTASNGGAGGTGLSSDINSVATTRAGGGGGGAYGGSAGPGGTGGGGAGGANAFGVAGTVNTGGGSGGGGKNMGAGTNPSGGSGLVIIRYKFQN